MKKVLIVEDNADTLQYLKKLVFEVDGESEVFLADNIKDALEYTVTRKIDLFLVDIILNPGDRNDMSGFLLIDNIRQLERYQFTPVIIVSALEDSRQYAYEHLHCFGYVEKPFHESNIKYLVSAALEFHRETGRREMLYYRQDGVIYGVPKADIIYAELVKRQICIYTKKGKFHVRYRTIKRLLDEMGDPDILQCNRNTIVNSHFVSNIDIPNGMLQLMNIDRSIEIGGTFKKSIKEFYKKWML